MAINPRTYEQATAGINRNLSSRFIAEISDVFTHLSAQDRKSRKREKTRRDLVRIQFETSPATAASARSGLASQLGKLLKLD